MKPKLNDHVIELRKKGAENRENNRKTQQRI